MTHNRGMLTNDQLRQRLNALPQKLSEVARRAGLPTKTVYRIASGANRPRIDTAERVYTALQAVEDIEKAKALLQREAA